MLFNALTLFIAFELTNDIYTKNEQRCVVCRSLKLKKVTGLPGHILVFFIEVPFAGRRELGKDLGKLQGLPCFLKRDILA